MNAIMTVTEAEQLVQAKKIEAERHEKAEAIALQARELRRKAEDAAGEHGRAQKELRDLEVAVAAVIGLRDALRAVPGEIAAKLATPTGQNIAHVVEGTASSASATLQRHREKVGELKAEHGRRVEELERFLGKPPKGASKG